ncbi:MAG TPA: cyclic nucleotide-binding domain-containing protein [Terracidiphilus sp.]|jgi:CRP/FNR family transcriptional regulator|nr:cyclic nucleotide-binding domain-containing protein [Terracidiphilus sp.]
MNLDSSAFVGDRDLILALSDQSAPVDCSRDHVLFRQGDEPNGLYIVHRGDVSMTMRAPDGELVVEIAVQPGSLLGLPGVVGNCPYSLSAIARSGAEIGFISRDALSKLMLYDPAVGILILRVLAAEVRTARIAACKG